ncbi:MAG: protein-arginine deiminase family protein [Myxococcota bacterium]|nr:protein-arginine deiminase family protein [Myxococcota bacterium]
MTAIALLALVGCDKDGDDTGALAQLAVHTSQYSITLDDLSMAVPGVVGVPNLDDDDSDGTTDWVHGLGREGEEDFTTIQLEMPHRTTLTLLDGADKVRIYHEGTQILGGETTSVDLSRNDSLDDFQVEFSDYRATAMLQVLDYQTQDVIEVQLTASPMILNHHLQPSELVTMVNMSIWGGNASMQQDYQDNLGEMFDPVEGANFGYDVWIQDELEFTNTIGADGHLDVVMDLIRDGQGILGGNMGLASVATKNWVGPDMGRGVWGTGPATSQDYGGNIEVAPPTSVDGVDYPFGRIYYGAQGRYDPAEEVKEHFANQAIQAPFELDSSWLCVGHVDEWFTTIPVEGSRLGWKLVYSDMEAAREVLEAADASTTITRFAQDKEWATIGELVEDQAMWTQNENLTNNVLEPQLDILKAELGLTEDDIIRIPGLFETAAQCGGGVAALFPGMANLIVATDQDGVTTLFVPDPMMRTNVSDESSDPIIAAFSALMPPELNLVFVDDWDVYHLGLGEVHCGSNVIRTPYEDATWWADGWHLMQESN